MKKLLLVSILFYFLLLTWCSQQDASLSKSELFDKKKECAGYSNQMKDYVDDQYNWEDVGVSQTSYIKDIFYSPVRNTCMYTITTTSISNLRSNGGILVIDFFTKEVILNITDYCSMREDELSEWKDCKVFSTYLDGMEELRRIKWE